MRKLVVWNLMTLDGYFEGTKPWDLDFHMLAWGDELERYATDLGREGDLLIFGRKTYEGMAAYWQTATETPDIAAYMNGIAKIAASRTMGKAEWNNTRVVSDIAAEVKKLKEEPGKIMFVFGSAEVTDVLLKAGLVDEIRICLVPVVLGAGNPHFKPAGEQRPMKLIDSRPLKTGAVILRYEPVKTA
ncbi:dihydrofolate reductase [Agrobacterium rhizogenes]|uniref:Pyrimidine reductase protein (Dihydrofolate reductase family) n=1 Tax=Rhizobium rhizogenes (strain K84 / ATCC BAA-868) TaxID=311403 RepID=B9J913_RHIR8|nr:dihydrofolate reductase family protein [Rhizobium rhizogenes]ACM25415.1 pyrimidine reductase protein (dihydrofolate reductase family) [Rhizobium rhizogenes K84]OCJ21759.1 riboflavin biosynthesis protein RibD [Agrobacterium sp. B131/95]OCJ26797.1 riboflavin biosynthesis protein RibD [Agrobacterium sp. B133/95]NTI40347.1 dihydrofolate reductase [Rhizobium rhizogenes]NTI47396.1 dihydrofolate reductase [Rhizobium rhizogenes]